MSDFDENVEKYLTDVNVEMLNGSKGMVDLNLVTAQYGRNYIKVVRKSYDRETMKENELSGSVYSFIVKNENDKKFNLGDILKPQGWKAPARNFARGNVFKDDYFPINRYGV